MNLLLTSGGITNQKIKDALLELVGRPFDQLSAVLIPTAANVEEGDKTWLDENIAEIKDCGFRSVDIIDIAVTQGDDLKVRLEKANIFFVGGGNMFYLMHEMKESGFQDYLPELLQDRVYVGISAGSCVIGRLLEGLLNDQLYPGEENAFDVTQGLELVNFCVLPHLNSESFPNLREEKIKNVLKNSNFPVYAIDDFSAIRVFDDKVEVVGGGKYIEIR